MNITIIGVGYVGLVNGACLANMGHIVNCIDINEAKITSLKLGNIPIYEPGLENIVKTNINEGRLLFSTDYNSVKKSDLVFIAVGTPTIKGKNEANLIYIENAIKKIAMNLEKETIIVMKSTVPVGTCEKMKQVIGNIITERGITGNIWFDVISNPEFLKEGDAVNDFLNPDRIIIGADNNISINKMKELYGENIVIVSTKSSEMIKYASNAMLATRISFMNELANLSSKVGVNIDEVKLGIGLDKRIGDKFLNPGCGYGGSCFPKDVNALLALAEENEIELKVVKATKEANERQKHVVLEKLMKLNNFEVNGKTISILGLSFKPNTDDMREAPSITIVKDIQENFSDIKIKLYDPIARFCTENMNILNEHKNTIRVLKLDECLKGSDIIILVTEWDEFKKIDWKEVSKIVNKNALVIDGRNALNGEEIFNNNLRYIRI